MPRRGRLAISGFELFMVPDGRIRVQCLSDCYEAHRSGWRKSATTVGSFPEARAWAAAHTHRYSLVEARAKCSQMARERWTA